MQTRAVRSLFRIVVAGCAFAMAHLNALGEDEGNARNRLSGSTSPYLLQHADNPVNWFPWGDEAFARARAEKKPIFLSIGYATCHWCHVMERESFKSPEIAAILNEHFISIKVDREERPDVDRLYMTFVQAAMGSGGWPLNVWLTPDLRPFFGGTYFPPEDQYGRPGFATMLERIASSWSEDREGILAMSEEILEQLRAVTDSEKGKGGELPIESWVGACYRDITSLFDESYGGFGRGEKFPSPAYLEFLFQYSQSADDDGEALKMALQTLRAMADGGIRDHIGGGFHRYTVDVGWRLPHFEKMLYDQAQLARLYTIAYQIEGEEYYASIAREILDYAARVLASPNGGFYAAEDAESYETPASNEKSEGAFYLWEEGEWAAVLDGTEVDIVSKHYGIEENGNIPFVLDRRNELAGKNLPYIRVGIETLAEELGEDPETLRTLIDEARERLLKQRSRRPHPRIDSQIITSWNGLMISALAQAAGALPDDGYLEQATRTAYFLSENLYDSETRTLYRSHAQQRRSDVAGFAEDYALLIRGLIDLYAVAQDPQWLQWAVALQEEMNELFWDGKNGGYFETRANTEIPLRSKGFTDSAVPSANSVSAGNLIELAELLDRKEWRAKARALLTAFAGDLERAPIRMPLLVASAHHLDKAPCHVVIAGDPGAAKTRDLLECAWKTYLPNAIILLMDAGKNQKYLAAQNTFYETFRPIKGKPTAYYCEDFVCQLPTHDVATLKRQMTAKTDWPR